MVLKSFTTKAALALASAVLCAASASAAGPIGELEVRGQSRVSQADASGQITVNNTRYAWFSGDRIETRAGANAILNLDAGASLGFGENSVARVSVDNGIAVALDRGVFLYAVEDRAGAMTLVSGDYVFSTAGDEPRVLQVSDQPAVSIGMIRKLEDGSVEVTVSEGVLEATHADAGLRYPVAAGEQVRFGQDEVRAVQVQVEVVTEETARRGLWALFPNNAVAAVALGVGAGLASYGVYRWQFRSSSPDEEPVSP